MFRALLCPKHVETEVNNKHLIVASCWSSLFILYNEVLVYVNSCHMIMLLKSKRGIRQDEGNTKYV